MKSTTKIIIGALVIVAIAFYGGLKYGQSKSVGTTGSQSTLGGAAQFPGGLARRGGNGGGAVRGDIVKKDNQSIVISLPSGGSQIIWYSTSTEVQKTVIGSSADLNIGQTVAVSGSANSDGSLSANSIQLRSSLPSTNNNNSQN
ncbi:MAG: hypothetical protein WC640_04060 [Candidatus Paceibacterota bacterium]|jgi:hypothetical protein